VPSRESLLLALHCERYRLRFSPGLRGRGAAALEPGCAAALLQLPEQRGGAATTGGSPAAAAEYGTHVAVEVFCGGYLELALTVSTTAHRSVAVHGGARGGGFESAGRPRWLC
jgi:hypothetical protein